MKNKKFFYGTIYLALLSAITLFFWFFKLESYGLPLFLIALFLVFVLFKDVMPAVPILLNALFMISKTEWSLSSIPLYLYLAPVALLGGIVIHIIRFKVNIFRGKMLFGIVLMFVAMLLSTINAEIINLNYLFYALIGLVYAFVYLFFLNSMEGDHKTYLLKMMFILGILVSVEVLMYYLRVEDVIYALENKTINLGWGISNYVATYLIVFIPTTFYFAKKMKFNILLIIVAVFQIIMLLFTDSRGGITAFAFVFVLLLIYLFNKKNWGYTLLSIGITLAILSLVIYLNYDMFLAMFERFKLLLFDDSGRLDIYADAWRVFKEHPLFGVGIFSRLDEFGDFRMYHNTVLHVLASFGVIGVISLVIQVFMMFKITLTKINSQTIILCISILGAHAHGMVDNVYLMPQFMILLFIIIAVIESSNKYAEIDKQIRA